jgi:hypothetical protein
MSIWSYFEISIMDELTLSIVNPLPMHQNQF